MSALRPKASILLSAILFCGLLLSSGCGNGTKKVRIRAFIDGQDTIRIQGQMVWYEHENWELPGRWQGHHEATYVNGDPWQPDWHNKSSYPYKNLRPAFQPVAPPQITLTKILGRGEVKITELPSADNSQTLSVHIDDDPPGADWYEFEVDWK